jgi:MOSC domain-containing protein YiiM
MDDNHPETVAAGTVVSVNVGLPRVVTWHGRSVTSGIWKEPCDGAVEVRGINLAGDDQADRRVHGGRDKAVYAYSTEDYDWWSSTTGPLGPGTFGENLTTTGMTLNACAVGDRWHVGTCVLEVAQPREPCYKLGIRMGDDAFPERFTDAQRPGVYLRIIEEGHVRAGDAIRVEPAGKPSVTIGEMVRPQLSDATLSHLAGDPRLPGGWRARARRAMHG